MIERKTNVVLDHETHIYTDTETGNNPMSVSKFFDQFKEPFDREGISWLMARKELRLAIDPDWYSKYSGKEKPDGPEPFEEAIIIKKAAILKGWEDKLINSQNVGNDIHSPAEQILLGNKIDPVYNGLKKAILPYFAHNYKNFPEIILHSEKYGIAGMEDNMAMRQRSKNSHLDFCDFKTNVEKGIMFDSTKLQDNGKLKHYNSRFKKPINYLEDCNYIEYALKMSLYAYMAEEQYGMPIGKLFILFIAELDAQADLAEKIFDVTYIPLPYMKYDVIRMLEWHHRRTGGKAPKKKVVAKKPIYETEDF